MSEEKIEAPVFDDESAPRDESEQLLVYLGSFDGPIDMLLSLARDQKLDLSTISILDIANQYLEFIEKARSLRLELAADYLVMAAWLAYLKSRLLVPEEEKHEEEPSAQEMADALQFQLRRLEAMRNIADQLFNQPRLGVDIFARGAPEGLRVSYKAVHEVSLYDLLKSYSEIRVRAENKTYKPKRARLFSLEESMERLSAMLGKIPADWISLFSYLPNDLNEPLVKRSAVASTFGASLELAKRGVIQLRQEGNFSPIYVRRSREEQKQAEDAAAAQTGENQ